MIHAALSKTVDTEMLADTGSNKHITPHVDLPHDYELVPKGYRGLQWGGNALGDLRGISTLIIRGPVCGDQLAQHLGIPDVSWVCGERCTLLGGKRLTLDTCTYLRMAELGKRDGLYDQQTK
jgi:hypothetical protein